MKTIGLVIHVINDSQSIQKSIQNLQKHIQSGEVEAYFFFRDNLNDSNLRRIIDFQKKYPDSVKVAYRAHDSSSPYNLYTSVNLFDTTYIYSITTKDLLSPNFTKYLLQIMNKFGSPDVIEISTRYLNRRHTISKSKLAPDIYIPGINKEVFALVHHGFHTKVISRRLLKNMKAEFHANKLFEFFYNFQILKYANKVVVAPKGIVGVNPQRFEEFNSVDIAKQWEFLLEYASRKKLLKKLSPEIEYQMIKSIMYYLPRLLIRNGAPKHSVVANVQKGVDQLELAFPNWKKNVYLTNSNNIRNKYLLNFKPTYYYMNKNLRG